MKVTSLILASTAVLVAHAQTQDSVCSKDLTAPGQGELDTIKNCKTYTGTITIANTPAGALTLNGVESIQGNLVVSASSALQHFSAPQLKIVTGNVLFAEQLGLAKLELPVLTQVNSLTLSVLPMLETIDFPAGLSKANALVIDDTPAATVTGLTMDAISTLTLIQNTHMKRFELPAKDVTGGLLVLGNGQELDFQAPNLVSLHAAEFREVGNLNAPMLKMVAGDFSFHQNNFVSLGLDSLEDVGGTMTIANNDRLTELSFKKLSLIREALSIGNNAQLTDISGFPSLSSVHGTVDLVGRFDRYDMPQLLDVRGGMSIDTTSTSFNCPQAEQKLKLSSVVKGNVWSCKASKQEANVDTASGSGGDSSSSSSSSNDSGTLDGGRSGNDGAVRHSPKKQNGAASGADDLAASASSATTTRAHITAAMMGAVAMVAGFVF